MLNVPETRKICRINDPDTNIGYKIIYRASKDRYEIWAQYKDDQGILHRNRVTYDEAIRRERHLFGLIGYVKEYLVGNHIRFFDEVIEKATQDNNSYIAKQSRAKKYISQKRAAKPVINRRENSNLEIIILPGTKSAQLEQLFLKWENAQKNEPDTVWKLTNGGNANITKEHFRRDGIIDEATYNNEKVTQGRNY